MNRFHSLAQCRYTILALMMRYRSRFSQYSGRKNSCTMLSTMPLNRKLTMNSSTTSLRNQLATRDNAACNIAKRCKGDVASYLYSLLPLCKVSEGIYAWNCLLREKNTNTSKAKKGHLFSIVYVIIVGVARHVDLVASKGLCCGGVCCVLVPHTRHGNSDVWSPFRKGS